MHHNHIIPDSWSIIQEGFDKDLVKSSESLFSIGNGAMGQRANFEEQYTGDSLQGSYIGGVYYPDKTKVGWWKNGYPEYFAKVLNAPNWIGINVEINGKTLDLNTIKVSDYKQELNMKEGWLKRSFNAKTDPKTTVRIEVLRFISMDIDELGVIKYTVTPINNAAEITFKPYVDSDVTNQDANWEETFWEHLNSGIDGDFGFVQAKTLKTGYNVVTFMENALFLNNKQQAQKPLVDKQTTTKIQFKYQIKADQNEAISLIKYGGYTVSTNHPEDKLQDTAQKIVAKAKEKGFDSLLKDQKEAWQKIWEMSDITIEGDVKAQQGIRFNIFQLNQTYSGKDSRLNIGPKGFTGEKYGGSTYWDTEAFCFTFYMATKGENVANNLLKYRYNHLENAIENAKTLGFKNGAALYPMVTMNGEESHNEWEITFEEIHRNGAVAFAIYNYTRYTGKTDYLETYGLEVLIAIARFWKQRVNFSEEKQQYVILGVTGPNEYENNIDNNFHTNYFAKWCLDYTAQTLHQLKSDAPETYIQIVEKTNFLEKEIKGWQEISKNLYFPYSEKHKIYLQQDGFLNKTLTPVDKLNQAERPLNQYWSWDRVLRSPYIKQADTLQTFYVFEEDFKKEELANHFDFYEPLTVHESSLSPCVHSVLAARLGKMDKAYEFYLRTSRLDLDDYNKEIEEGLHITSMAGSWMSIVEGFGGMKITDNKLHFKPQLPKEWKGYSFKINFRGHILTLKINENEIIFTKETGSAFEIVVNDKTILLSEKTTLIKRQ